MTTTPALWRLYRLLILDHTYYAAYLHRHAARLDLDDAELAALLGCGADTLPHVGLTLRSVDAATVEGRFGLRRGSLAELVG